MMHGVNSNNFDGSRGFAGLEVAGESPAPGIYMRDKGGANALAVSKPMGFKREMPIRKDIIGHIPKELAVDIFEMLKAELPNLALVNKQFAKIADSKEITVRIFPIYKAFGENDYKKYYDVEVVGKVPQIPRRAYGDLEKKGGRLTLVPQKVKVILDEEQPLTNKLMGRLAKNANSEHKTGYDPDSWMTTPIEPKTTSLQKICCCLPTSWFTPSEEATHWVWTERDAIGHGKHYVDQEALAKQQELSPGVTGGANVVGARDGIVTAFTTFTKTGEGCFGWDPTIDYTGTWIRSKDKVDGSRVVLRFGPSGLFVYYHSYDYDADYDGVAVARKSFGT